MLGLLLSPSALILVITKIIFLVSFLNTEAACFGLLAPPPRPPGPQHVTRHVLGLVTRDTWPRDLTSHVTTTSTGGCPLARPLYVNRSRYITHAVDVDCKIVNIMHISRYIYRKRGNFDLGCQNTQNANSLKQIKEKIICIFCIVLTVYRFLVLFLIRS